MNETRLKGCGMRMLAWAILLTILSGCLHAPVSVRALCAGTEELRTRHADALVEDGGPESRTSGRALIATIDAGCAGKAARL